MLRTNGQKIIRCNVEEIEAELNHCMFDIIYSKNALDHTYNPIKAISNILCLLNDKGVVILEHYNKEGEYTNYFGLHQWDFYIENGNFCISSEDKHIVQDINALYPLFDIESYYEKNKIINIIRKL